MPIKTTLKYEARDWNMSKSNLSSEDMNSTPADEAARLPFTLSLPLRTAYIIIVQFQSQNTDVDSAHQSCLNVTIPPCLCLFRAT